ncbi:MAG TPA: class I SAM-dependent methyltransferase [Rhizomicrobium sp.]|nr:class I SAM-dependent methyltransferase [Rhizomicrobium sp.]
MKRRLRQALQYIAHPISRWERLYATENPWRFDIPSEIYRFEETNRIIRQRVGPVETILEIGSGEGDQTKWLLKLADRVEGIDISPTAIERARSRFANNPKASFSAGRLPDIGVGERFDLVTAFEIIYYVKDIPRALEMMDRLGQRRIVSVHWPQVRVLDEFLFPTRNASRQVITWEDKPRWLVAWW